MLYQISNGAVDLGGETILENINFEIHNTEKIAIVGRNGCGKTTLLRLIAGEVDLKRNDSVNSFISVSNKIEIGYLKQGAFEDTSITLNEEIQKVFSPILKMQERMDELLKIMNSTSETFKVDEKLYASEIKEYTALQEKFELVGGYYYQKEYDVMLRQFGFSLEDKTKKICEFSGGQQTKLAFIKLLLSKPDVLLLDEPTNHLDITTVEWLEDYLKNYKKAVVVVSHDRMFLDKISDVVYEIEYKKTKRYVGNYSDFMELKRLSFEKQKKDYEMQQKEIARLQALVERFKNTPTKVAMTRSKLKEIEHMEIIDAPERFDTSTFHANFKPNRQTGKEVLKVNNLSIGYDEILSTVNFTLIKKQKVGIIGGNGLGKSTFLKTIMGLVDAISGDYSFGHQVDVGYFDQQMAQYISEKTVLDDFWDEYPTLDRTEIRSSLGAFMFSGDDVFKTVDVLSGGEKVRLALCKIFKTKPNFLILDEPTNHMDIIGKEALETMIKEFEGSVLFVSHDRYFIKQIADSLIVFENGTAEFLPYGYDEYIERKKLKEQSSTDISNNNNETAMKPKTEIQKGKAIYEQTKERSKLEKRYLKLEQEISQLEDKLKQKNDQLLLPEYASDFTKLEEISLEIEQIEEQLLSAMEQWDDISAKLQNQ